MFFNPKVFKLIISIYNFRSQIMICETVLNWYKDDEYISLLIRQFDCSKYVTGNLCGLLKSEVRAGGFTCWLFVIIEFS